MVDLVRDVEVEIHHRFIHRRPNLPDGPQQL
jgi:hypothetical protein